MSVVAEAGLFSQTALDSMWEDVPGEFRVWTYDLHRPPFARALRGTRSRNVVLEVDALSESVRRELAWWVWWCQAQSNRRVSVDIVQHLVAAVREIERRRPGLAPTRSLAEVSAEALSAAFRRAYRQRNGRLPGTRLNRTFNDEIRFLRFAFERRYSGLEWWQHDVWSPRHDPRIPIRAHEPLGAQAISFAKIEPEWLRESLKFYGHVSLEAGELTWGTLMSRVFHIGAYFGSFVTGRRLGPELCEQPIDDLHEVMADYLNYLRQRRRTQSDKTQSLSALTIRQAQVALRGFYAFLVDHRHETAATLDDPRFLGLGPAHLRLWRRSEIGPDRRRFGPAPDSYIAEDDLAKMIDHLELLGMATDESKVIIRYGAAIRVNGLGDASAMRAWLIQALTGRRANEILMLDFNPLHPVPGLDSSGGEEAVARLHYRQTKIAGAPDTILVGGDVVALVAEQQTWTRGHLHLNHTDPDPPYLFPSLNRNPRGARHRSLSGYSGVLQTLTEKVALVDRQGRRLEYSKSHRLRHTKATNLLNLGAPLHVVMRYMGHHSEVMTLHYAQTLAETAEREFLRTRKIGADGRDLELSPQDVYDMIALSERTDRVLPTGVCLLPPVKRCEKGNACYSCGYFATDATFLADHRQLLSDTLALVEKRKQLHLERTGRAMTDDNVWLQEQLATINALHRIIASLEAHQVGQPVALKGAGSPRQPAVSGQPVHLSTNPDSQRGSHARR